MELGYAEGDWRGDPIVDVVVNTKMIAEIAGCLRRLPPLEDAGYLRGVRSAAHRKSTLPLCGMLLRIP